MKGKVNWFLINENYGANLSPYAFHFDADYWGFKKILGRGMHYQAVGTENGFLRQAYDLDDYNSFAKFVFNKLSSDRRFARLMLGHVYAAIRRRHLFDKKVLRTNLQRLSNTKLAVLFEKFYWYFFDMSAWSVPFAFTEYGTPLWTNYLMSYLNKLDLLSSQMPAEIYQILTSNSKQTYTAREKENILKLAMTVKKSRALKALFRKPTERIIGLAPVQQKVFWHKLKQHVRRYAWINFGFEGPLLSEEYFIGVIKDWVLHKNPRVEYKKIKKDRGTLVKKQNRLLNQLRVDEKHRWMFWVVREFGFQKTYRKDVEYYSYYTYDVMLQELARRLGATVNQAHYLLKDEIIAILQGKKQVDVSELNERIRCNFYVVINGRGKLLVGKRARQFIKKIKARPVPKGLHELSGQCAFPGKVNGKVKVIRGKEDYSKFKSGDILVFYATNPNMVSLMKMARAIVTDEGGVTCHAAIVSRELRIPCVIGTRFATKILKDGARVEVDASKGIVKKLN